MHQRSAHAIKLLRFLRLVPARAAIGGCRLSPGDARGSRSPCLEDAIYVQRYISGIPTVANSVHQHPTEILRGVT